MNRYSVWPENTRWPQYLPYPKPIGKPVGPVPNRTAIDWPQAQFAPSFLPQGSASVQTFSYQPNYRTLYGIGGSVYQTETTRNEYGCATCGGEKNYGWSTGGEEADENPAIAVDTKSFVLGALAGAAALYIFLNRTQA